MPVNIEVSKENLKKAHAKTRRGAKGKKTIEREKMREHYETYAAKKFEELTNSDINFAVIPKQWQARKGVIEQLIGKAKERWEGDLKVNIDEDFEKQLKRAYGGDTGEEKTN